LQLLLLAAFVLILLLDLKTEGVEEIFEWWLATFSCLYFYTTFHDWRDFRLTRQEKKQAMQQDDDLQGVSA